MQTLGLHDPHGHREDLGAAPPVRTRVIPCAAGVMSANISGDSHFSTAHGPRTVCAVGLKECARRIGMSHSHARHLVADGTFPIPELKRRPGKSHHQYSEAAIAAYLQSDTSDASTSARGGRPLGPSQSTPCDVAGAPRQVQKGAA